MAWGIVSWGVYLPHWRLERSAIAAALGGPAGRGSRSVAAFDEDTTTLAVEAARRALLAPGIPAPSRLVLSTPAPAYQDRTNATTVHAALGLAPDVGAYDLCGSVRSAWGALRQAAEGSVPTLAVLSDLRTGLPGSTDEREAGDGAVAVLCGPDPVAQVTGWAAATDEVLDRWRAPGEVGAHLWEERFGEEVLVPLARRAALDACAAAGTTPGAIDHLVVAGLATRAVRAAAGGLGVRPEAQGSDWSATVGNLGAAQAVAGLVDALERARPGQRVLVLQVADGADAAVVEVTEGLPDALGARRRAGLHPVSSLVGAPHGTVSYPAFLTWRGLLPREPPRRPDPERPGAPVTHRSTGWKYGFAASRCTECGFRHLPPTRVCLRCRAVDRMVPERLADVRGTVATYTVDRLAASPAPPVVGAVIDFDGGGRYRGQLADVDADALRIGTRVEMVFRRVYTAAGVHNYFWKARPVAGEPPADGVDVQGSPTAAAVEGSPVSADRDDAPAPKGGTVPAGAAVAHNGQEG